MRSLKFWRLAFELELLSKNEHEQGASVDKVIFAFYRGLQHLYRLTYLIIKDSYIKKCKNIRQVFMGLFCLNHLGAWAISACSPANCPVPKKTEKYQQDWTSTQTTLVYIYLMTEEWQQHHVVYVEASSRPREQSCTRWEIVTSVLFKRRWAYAVL